MKRLLFLLTLFVVLGMQAQQHVMTVDVSKTDGSDKSCHVWNLLRRH